MRHAAVDALLTLEAHGPTTGLLRGAVCSAAENSKCYVLSVSKFFATGGLVSLYKNKASTQHGCWVCLIDVDGYITKNAFI